MLFYVQSQVRKLFWLLMTISLLMACTPTLEPLTATREVAVQETAVPSTPDAVATLITQLEQTGAIIHNEGDEPGFFDGATGTVRLTINGSTVRVITFPTLATRQRISDALAPDGFSLTLTEGDVTTNIYLDGEPFPHFWAQDTLIINYVGTDTATVAILTNVLGSPIADGSRPYPTPTPHVPWITPTPAAAPTPLPIPTPNSNIIAITEPPIFDDGAVRLQGWSPDGRYLAYFIYTQEQLDASPGPPGAAEGTFTLYDSATGAICQQYPLSGTFSYEGPGKGQQFTWLPDGSFFVLTQDGRVLQSAMPCGGDVDLTAVFPEPLSRIESLSPDQSLLLLTSQNSYLFYNWQTQAITLIPEVTPDSMNNLVWSPDGTYLAITLAGNYTGDRNPIGGSRVVDITNGQIIARHDWEPAHAVDGAFGGPEWISPTEFVVTVSLDQGPFLMNVDGEIRPLLPLFGLEFVRDQMSPIAATYVDQESSTYHILLSGLQWFDDGIPAQIYHSDSAAVEQLGITNYYLASSGLISTDDGLARQITAVNQPFVPMADSPCYAPGFTPQSTLYLHITGSANTVELYSLPECRHVATVQIPDEYAGQYLGGRVSPDGRFLAITPTDTNGYAQALFVIPLDF
ncbi:MAG: hypothetical protein H6662_11610 [Ardenticatenaceae bacterium]|nr:hypothetical protein [Anaerolineales bacterium]MCB8922221.1 hypothetical protein [Ardenticatenaceae bacterium]